MAVTEPVQSGLTPAGLRLEEERRQRKRLAELRQLAKSHARQQTKADELYQRLAACVQEEGNRPAGQRVSLERMAEAIGRSKSLVAQLVRGSW